MHTLLGRDGDEGRFLLVGVDPGLHASAGELFAACPEGFERRVPWRGDVETAFERGAASVETMLRQHAGLEPMPWQAVLHRFAGLLDGEVEWQLVGSCALAVSGIAGAPRGIDVVVAESNFAGVVRRLHDHLVEPVAETDDWIARWFCRA